MNKFTIKSAKGRELERQAGVLRRSGSLAGQKAAAFKSQHARAVEHADAKARNARRG